jgi:hypothetical protein
MQGLKVALGCSTDKQLWFRIALISSNKKAATIFDDTLQVGRCRPCSPSHCRSHTTNHTTATAKRPQWQHATSQTAVKCKPLSVASWRVAVDALYGGI